MDIINQINNLSEPQQQLIVKKRNVISNDMLAAKNQSIRTHLLTKQKSLMGTKNKKKNKKGGNSLFNKLSRVERISRRIFRTPSFINSTAGGLIAIAYPNTLGVTSATDWTNGSQEYQAYRIVKIAVFGYPTLTTSTPPNYVSSMYLCKWYDSVSPGSFTVLASEPSAICVSTLQEFYFENTWDGFLEAHEWTPTSSNIATSQQYGIAYMTATGHAALPAVTTVFNLLYEFYVEFLGTS